MLNSAEMRYWFVWGEGTPAILPMLIPVMGTFVGGGGGVALKVKVTAKELAPCGAEAGVTV